MPNKMVFDVDQLAIEVGGKKLLHGITFQVPAGKLVGIIGPNGAGKTTLLKALLGFLPASQGQVLLNGQPIAAYPPRQRARLLAFLQQESPPMPHMRIGAFLELAYFPLRGEVPVSVWKQRRDELCREFALLDQSHRPIAELSGGEKQRLFLIQSLLQFPMTLLLDEITNHLDIAYQLDILQYLKQLPQTKIMVLHDLNLAARFCDILLLLDRGEMKAFGDSSQVLTPDFLQKVFGVSVDRVHDQQGTVQYIFQRSNFS
jgi:iron complex transport system ATP-binding protein